jgi:hypothetical protein
MVTKETDISTLLRKSKIELQKGKDGKLRAASSFYYGSLNFELISTYGLTENGSRVSQAVLKTNDDLVFDKISSTDGLVSKIRTTYGNAVEGIRESFYLIERTTDAIFVTGNVDGHKLVPLRLGGGIVIQPCSLDSKLLTFMTSEVVPINYRFNIRDRSEFGGLERVIDAKSTEFSTSRQIIGNQGVTEAECWKCWKEFYCCLEGGNSEDYCDTMLHVCNITCKVGDILGQGMIN